MRLLGYVLVCGCLTSMVGTTTGCKKKEPPAAAVVKAEPAKKAPEPPKVEKKEEERDPKAPKERKGVAENVRSAALRPEIQSDMRTVGQLYVADTATGTEPKTEQEMKAMLRGAGAILRKVEEGQYVINLHGRKPRPNEIILYEHEASSPAGFCVVRASGQVDVNLPFEELKKELGMK